jgi:hypothetical protein
MPTMALYSVMYEVVIAGDDPSSVTLHQREVMQQAVAEKAEVHVSRVRVKVQGGSVLVSFEVDAEGGDVAEKARDAQAIQERLLRTMATPEQATSVLGAANVTALTAPIDTLRTEVVSVLAPTMPPAPPSLPPNPPIADLSDEELQSMRKGVVEIALAAGIGGSVGLCILFVILWLFLCRKRTQMPQVVTRMVSTITGESVDLKSSTNIDNPEQFDDDDHA